MMTWFGALPAHWKIARIGSCLEENIGLNTDCSLKNALQFRYGEIIEKARGETKENLKRYIIVKQDDIIVNGLNLNYDFITQRVAIVKKTGAITPAYISLHPKRDINPKFACYVLKTMDSMKLLHGMGTGIRLTLGYSELKQTLIPLPRREEQDQIVRYLDWKMSSINKLINTKRKQIALMKDMKQTIINRALTRGLDANVSMQDSGVDWIGKIPSDWSTCRCKFLFSERNERSENGNETHLSMSQKYGLIPDEQLDERRFLSESYSGGKICYKDDLVLNRLKAHLGVFALAPQMGVISPDYTVLQPDTKKILPKYAEYILKSESCRRELRVRVQGVVEGFWRLYTNDFYTIKVPLPSLVEQGEILRYIDEISRKYMTSVSIIENQISLLHEYKIRLISDTTTGKMDVSEIIVPKYETMDDVIEEQDESDEFSMTEESLNA